jgi:hypothetical protein
MKSKGMNDAQFLALLEKILPKATPDPRLASKIYDSVAEELRLQNTVKSFEKFCTEGSLPNLEPATVQEFRDQITTKFSKAQVTVEPTEKGDAVAVEIVLPDRKISNRLKVIPPGETAEDDETKAKFVPFPVALPDDPELLWVLARREDVGPDEAGILLTNVEEEFWETKAGLKLQQDRVEKTFAEFIANVPAAALTERGLKRHYKEPEPLKTLHRGPKILTAAERRAAVKTDPKPKADTIQAETA